MHASVATIPTWIAVAIDATEVVPRCKRALHAGNSFEL